MCCGCRPCEGNGTINCTIESELATICCSVCDCHPDCTDDWDLAEFCSHGASEGKCWWADQCGYVFKTGRTGFEHLEEDA